MTDYIPDLPLVRHYDHMPNSACSQHRLHVVAVTRYSLRSEDPASPTTDAANKQGTRSEVDANDVHAPHAHGTDRTMPGRPPPSGQVCVVEHQMILVLAAAAYVIGQLLAGGLSEVWHSSQSALVGWHLSVALITGFAVNPRHVIATVAAAQAGRLGSMFCPACLGGPRLTGIPRYENFGIWIVRGSRTGSLVKLW